MTGSLQAGLYVMAVLLANGGAGFDAMRPARAGA